MVKMQKKKSEGVRVGWRCHCGCERRIEVVVKMKKKSGGCPGWDGVGWGGKVSVDVKLKLL